MHNLDLHVEFQPREDVLCTVDYATRQCNEVQLTADSEMTNGKITQMQAIKFNSLGDFNYLIYASTNTFNMTTTNIKNRKPIIGNLKLYGAHHSDAIYEVDFPFQESYNQYWSALCIDGGRGMNSDGVRVVVQSQMTSGKPNVGDQCTRTSSSQTSKLQGIS